MLAQPHLPTLATIATSVPGTDDQGSKPPYIWTLYEQYLAPLRTQPVRMLELGIHQGASARAFARYFDAGRVVAIDLVVPTLDTSSYPNLMLLRCDQRDALRLGEISAEHAPDGWDIVIDDASHIGEYSLESFNALLPRLKGGGLYLVEDWCTGYWEPAQWGDGSKPLPPEPYDIEPSARMYHRRIRSHDFGMAGFVKSLVDHVVLPDNVFDWVHTTPWAVIAKKSFPRRQA